MHNGHGPSPLVSGTNKNTLTVLPSSSSISATRSRANDAKGNIIMQPSRTRLINFARLPLLTMSMFNHKIVKVGLSK
jgi:hypothetical protein